MEKIKFDGIEERLAGMIRIPTVNGSFREYRIDEYKNYLKAQFDTVFDTAAVLPVKDALLCRCLLYTSQPWERIRCLSQMLH